MVSNMSMVLAKTDLAVASRYADLVPDLGVELLSRFRAGQTDDRTRRAIHLTINGLAAGLRNSG